VKLQSHFKDNAIFCTKIKLISLLISYKTYYVFQLNKQLTKIKLFSLLISYKTYYVFQLNKHMEVKRSESVIYCKLPIINKRITHYFRIFMCVFMINGDLIQINKWVCYNYFFRKCILFSDIYFFNFIIYLLLKSKYLLSQENIYYELLCALSCTDFLFKISTTPERSVVLICSLGYWRYTFANSWELQILMIPCEKKNTVAK
jgi:hypothetical protein